jgi:hypothetical protein
MSRVQVTHRELNRLQAEYPGRLTIQFVNYPLNSQCNPDIAGNLHPQACLAAKIGIVMQSRNKFEQYCDYVFETDAPISEQRLWEVVEQLGENAQDIRREAEGTRIAAILQKDIERGRIAGIRMTPTLSINQKIIHGMDGLAQLNALLQAPIHVAEVEPVSSSLTPENEVASRAVTGCGCSANPGTLSSDAVGPCIRYPAPSGSVNDIVYRFDKAYACGQFANGDYFVVPDGTGRANITSISPAMTSGRHGIEVNPVPTSFNTGIQRFDSRYQLYQAPTVSFPYGAQGNQSIVKYVSSAGAASAGFGQFAAVLTVLSAAPANPASTFRPPYVGTQKPLHTTTELQPQFLSRLPRTPNTPTQATMLSWTRHIRLEYSPNSLTWFEPVDAAAEGRTWGGDMWKNDTTIVNWLQMADVCGTSPCTAAQDLAAKMPVLIGYVQYGIDIWAADKIGVGFWRGGGGNGAGKLFTYAFAATMLNNAQMKTDLANSDKDHFTESASYYRGVGGVALWGQNSPWDTDQQWWSEWLVAHNGSMTDPYHYIDGGGFPGESYQETLAQQTKYAAFLMRLMPAFRNTWTFNTDIILEYADRWVNIGAWAKPDPCAPKAGTYGTNYGPNGAGGCIPGAGRGVAYHGNNRNAGNRPTALGEELWAAYRDCIDASVCPGQAGTAVPPANIAPVANAGSDLIVTLPSNANLSGTATDDGRPNPPATLTYAWSKVSGPGTVVFANAAAKTTTASFSQTGTYVLRLIVSDSALSDIDDIHITVNNAPPPGGSPYSQWSNGPSTDPNVFPIGVWLQSPSRIEAFKNIGVNTFIGFYGNLDESSLNLYAGGQMPLMAEQNSVGLTSAQRSWIKGWTQIDEPDNAQPDSNGGYGPCIVPSTIVTEYNAIRANDTTRPVFLNFGRGAADTAWIGRGSCTGNTAYYPQAIQGGDIISFDIYPVADYSGQLELVAKGVDNLKAWSNNSKIIWNFIEGVSLDGVHVPTASQVKAEVWMSIIHGSKGIAYFVHQFEPTFRED